MDSNILSCFSSLVNRCATRISGDLSIPELALSGIMGFGQSNSSMLSQLASEGIVKKIFSHCLDSEQGGGIFSIGEVVEPKVKTTSLVSNTYVSQPFLFHFSLHYR